MRQKNLTETIEPQCEREEWYADKKLSLSQPERFGLQCSQDDKADRTINGLPADLFTRSPCLNFAAMANPPLCRTPR